MYTLFIVAIAKVAYQITQIVGWDCSVLFHVLYFPPKSILHVESTYYGKLVEVLKINEKKIIVFLKNHAIIGNCVSDISPSHEHFTCNLKIFFKKKGFTCSSIIA